MKRTGKIMLSRDRWPLLRIVRTLDDLFKARVKGHYRREQEGQMTWIRDYTDKRPSAPLQGTGPLLSGKRGPIDERSATLLFGNAFAGRSMPSGKIKPRSPQRGTVGLPLFNQEQLAHEQRQHDEQMLLFGDRASSKPTIATPQTEEAKDRNPPPDFPKPAPPPSPPVPSQGEKPKTEANAGHPIDASVNVLREKAKAILSGNDTLSPADRGKIRVALGPQQTIEGIKVLSMSDKTLAGHYLQATGGDNRVETIKPETKVQAEKPRQAPVMVPRDRQQAPEAIARSLYEKADSLTDTIQEHYSPAISRQNATARRARIASSMAQWAEKLERIQQVLRGLAQAHLNGTIPDTLKGIRNKSQVETLMNNRESFPYARARKDVVREGLKAIEGARGVGELRQALSYLLLRGRSGEELVRVDTEKEIKALYGLKSLWEKKAGKSHRWTSGQLTEWLGSEKRLREAGITPENYEQARKDMQSFISVQRSESSREREIREKKMDLIGSKIPGFFPTPARIGAEMAQDLNVQPGMDVIDPGAGFGDLLKEVRKVEPGAKLHAGELQSSLREILSLEGFSLEHADFLERTPADGLFDRIIMNPPFEGGQDMDHIRHAYSLLKPGGRIVALASEGPFFRQDKKASDFREWLDRIGAVHEPLAPGSFTGAGSFRQTGVNVRKIIIDKPEELTRSWGRKIAGLFFKRAA